MSDTSTLPLNTVNSMFAAPAQSPHYAGFKWPAYQYREYPMAVRVTVDTPNGPVIKEIVAGSPFEVDAIARQHTIVEEPRPEQTIEQLQARIRELEASQYVVYQAPKERVTPAVDNRTSGAALRARATALNLTIDKRQSDETLLRRVLLAEAERQEEGQEAEGTSA